LNHWKLCGSIDTLPRSFLNSQSMNTTTYSQRQGDTPVSHIPFPFRWIHLVHSHSCSRLTRTHNSKLPPLWLYWNFPPKTATQLLPVPCLQQGHIHSASTFLMLATKSCSACSLFLAILSLHALSHPLPCFLPTLILPSFTSFTSFADLVTQLPPQTSGITVSTRCPHTNRCVNAPTVHEGVICVVPV